MEILIVILQNGLTHRIMNKDEEKHHFGKNKKVIS